MIKVLIADDETWVRKTIADSLDWETHGFKLIGEARDGLDALNMIKLTKPDIVLADIEMPGMDGILLLKKLNEMKIQTLFIFFSGYDRFEYAQNAINLGALGYLLKPVDEEELLDMLLKAKEHFIEEREKEKSREQVEDLVERELTRKREDFLLSVVNGLTASEEDLDKRAKDLKMGFAGQSFVLLVFELDDYSVIAQKLTVDEAETVKHELIRITKSIMESYGCNSYCFKLYNRIGFAVNISGDDIEGRLEKIKTAGFKVKEEFKFKTEYSVTLGIGSIVSGIENIRRSYNVSCKCIEAKLILGKNRVIDGSTIKPKKIRTVILYSKIEKVITDCIEKCEKEAVDEIVAGIGRTFRGGGIDADDIRDFNYHFVELVFKVLNNMGVSSVDFLAPQITCNELDMSEDFEELLERIRKVLDLGIKAVSSSDTGYYKKLFTDIKRYIAGHYMQEISRESVAEEFTFSHNYFSKLFKEETGQNFIDYLTDYRIKIAREFLKDVRYSIFDVARMVGYSDAKYFTKVFKKAVGITPKEYIGKYKK